MKERTKTAEIKMIGTRNMATRYERNNEKHIETLEDWKGQEAFLNKRIQRNCKSSSSLMRS